MLLDNFAQVYYYGPVWFQWAPTLGGECYKDSSQIQQMIAMRFNGHPPLGVNATSVSKGIALTKLIRFNGHPPLGVNATAKHRTSQKKCSRDSFNGHPPLGVNATAG